MRNSDVKYRLNSAQTLLDHTPTPNIYVLSSPISPKQPDTPLLQVSALCSLSLECPTPDIYIAISLTSF